MLLSLPWILWFFHALHLFQMCFRIAPCVCIKLSWFTGICWMLLELQVFTGCGINCSYFWWFIWQHKYQPTYDPSFAGHPSHLLIVPSHLIGIILVIHLAYMIYKYVPQVSCYLFFCDIIVLEIYFYYWWCILLQ